MKLTLNRRWLTTKATVGELRIDGAHECFTCEDRYRPPPEPKVPRETCIPIGTFAIVITHSPRFGVLMPLLLGVDGFAGVRIHSGNTASDTEGCILVGRSREVDKVTGSREAYMALFKKLSAALEAGEPLSIDIAVTPHEGTP